MNTGIQKPPVAPKPRIIHSPKPGLSLATPKREAMSVPSPATTKKLKPVLAPKPGTSKLATAVASKTQSPSPESPLSVGLLNSHNGLHQENKRPNWDYIIPICLCSNKNCRCIKNETFAKLEKDVEKKLNSQTITITKTEQKKDGNEKIVYNGDQKMPQNITKNDCKGLNNDVLTTETNLKPENLKPTHKPFQEVLALYQNLNTVNPVYRPALTNSPSLPHKQSPDDIKASVTHQSAPGLETEEEDFDMDQPSSPAKTIPIPTPPIPVPVLRKLRKVEQSTQEEMVYKDVNEVSLDLQSIPSSSVNVPASVKRGTTQSRIPKPTFAPPAPPPRKKPFLSELGKSLSSDEVEEEDLGLDVHEMEISVDKEDNGMVSFSSNIEEPIYSTVESPRTSFIPPPEEEVVVKIPPQKPKRSKNRKSRSMESLEEKEIPKAMIMRALPLPPDEKTKSATMTKRASLSKAKSFSGADSNRPLKKNSLKMLMDLKLVVQKRFKARESQTQDNSDGEKELKEEDEAPDALQEYKGARKSSCPLIGREQSVDGDMFSPEKEPDQVYENIAAYEIVDYMNIHVGDDEVTSPLSREGEVCPTHNDENIYEEQEPYMTLQKDVSPPQELYDYPRNSFREDLPEERPSDEDIMDNTTEEEEDEEDTSSISSKGDPEKTVESATLKRKKNKIQHIATEIMTSENVFVDVLKLLHVDFRNAVNEASRQNPKPVIEDRLLDQILYNLPQLYELNQDLLKELRQRVETWGDNSKVADIFVKKGPYLKMYSTYIREFDKNVVLLEEQTKKNSAFAAVVREFEASPLCANLALKHYLLKPVQRIPQYKMLLTDYLKNLTEDSSDYKDTQEALVIVKEVANHANDIMKQGDVFQKLIQVQCRLIGQHEIVQPGRIFLKEGALNKLSRRVLQPRMFFLFNDMLLYTTPAQSGQYKVNNKLCLASMRVSKPALEAYQNELNIESVERSFILSASSATERDEWLEAISKAISDFRKKNASFIPGKITDDVDTGSGAPLGSKAPIWIPDSRVTMCMICTFKFTAAYRRHHCRACGKVICDSCSFNNYPLEYLKHKLARVCDPCYRVLQKEQNDKAQSCPVTNKSTFAFTRKHKNIPSKLKEVSANTANSSMSGYLERIKRNKKQGKRQWFVIKDMVLYTYAASEDVAALKSQPLLGLTVKCDSELQFKLFNKKTLMFTFKAADAQTAQRWIEAVKEASVLPN